MWDGWLEGRRRLADPAIQRSRTSRADCRASEGGGSGALGHRRNIELIKPSVNIKAARIQQKVRDPRP